MLNIIFFIIILLVNTYFYFSLRKEIRNRDCVMHHNVILGHMTELSNVVNDSNKNIHNIVENTNTPKCLNEINNLKKELNEIKNKQ